MGNHTVPLALAVVMVCAGCLGATPATEPTQTLGSPTQTPVSTTDVPPDSAGTSTAASPPTPKALPEKPTNLTRETVIPFVIAYEEVRLYDEQVRAGNYTSVETGCRNRSSDENRNGVSVTISCKFAVYDTDDGHVAVSDGATPNITYVVNETTIERHEHTGETPHLRVRAGGSLIDG